ncbi:VWA1 isoform 4, partial [Pan troglodytes]
MLPWTALGLALSLRLALARSSAERGPLGEGKHPLKESWGPGGPCLAVGLCGGPTPEAEHSSFPPGPPASAPRGDLMFLLDSSASVSHYEFSRVREFVGQLVAPLPLGTGALRASLVHVGSRPYTEFPFGQHSSGEAAQDAVRASAQRM